MKAPERTHRKLTGLMLLCSALLASMGNVRAASSAPPSVLWIMLDDGRADTLSCYGRPWADTPHMDRIAREGVRFETAIVQNPVCVPSRTSMKSGLYAHQTGVMAMGKPASTPGRYRTRSLNRYPNLLNAWSMAGITPENVGKAHAFREDWRLLGDAPRFLDNRGRPTSHLPPEWHRRLLSVVRTKTHRWMIGGLLDIPPGQIRTARLGDLALGRLRDLVRSPEPFFLRVSFHAPHVACSTTPSYFVDPSRIDLPLPTPGEIGGKPRYERENIHVYSGAPHLTQEEIGLARGTYYGMIRAVDREVGRLLSVPGTGRAPGSHHHRHQLGSRVPAGRTPHLEETGFLRHQCKSPLHPEGAWAAASGKGGDGAGGDGGFPSDPAGTVRFRSARRDSRTESAALDPG